MLIELFAAGTESTATSLRWGLLYLSLQQDIQERVAREIFDTLGEDGRPAYSDRHKMPYVVACLLEIQRVSNAVPTMYHSAYEAFSVRGYHVPEGTWIIPNFWFVHRDPKYWPNPDRFDPSRHLDTDGNVIQPTSFMPYSIGTYSILCTHLILINLNRHNPFIAESKSVGVKYNLICILSNVLLVTLCVNLYSVVH